MPNNVCSNCLGSGSDCARTTVARSRRRDEHLKYVLIGAMRSPELSLTEKPRHVEVLQARIKELEMLLREKESSETSQSGLPPTETHDSPSTDSSEHPTASPAAEAKPEPLSEDDTEFRPERVTKIAIIKDDEGRYFGNSSLMSLVSQAMYAKNKSLPHFIQGSNNEDLRLAIKRPKWWAQLPWQLEYIESQKHEYTFPERDLAGKLLDAYHEKVHIQIPVLHWPSFTRDVRKGRHLVDGVFGMLLLAVYAAASKYVEDDRVVVMDEQNPEFSKLSAGWRYISQTPLFRHSLIQKAEIIDIQYYVLAVFYFHGTSSPQMSWPLLGLAMRLAIEKGLHREDPGDTNCKERVELGKRVFCCLLSMEWMASSSLGRPACVHDEDIDFEYPIECDDEYWPSEVDDPTQAFKQPIGKPSVLTGLIWQLKLCEIASFMQRTLYSTKKSKLLTGRQGEGWEMRIVSQLDSAMNKWKGSLPEHLQWNPDTPSMAFFNQQVFLHSSFFYLQIQIHRPILSTTSPLSAASLAICTSAARACIRLTTIACNRANFHPLVLYNATFASSMVLALNIWGKDPKSEAVRRKDIEDLDEVLRFNKRGENRWHLVSRFADILTQTVSMGASTEPIASSNWEPSPAEEPSRPVDIRGWAPPTWSPTPHPAPGSTSPFPGLSFSSGPSPPSYDFDWTPMLEESTSNPASELPVDSDWDLTRLWMAQTQFDQNIFNMPVTYDNTYAPVESSMMPGAERDEGNHGSTTGLSQPLPNEQPDMSTMGIWTSAPTAFSIEEWDQYFASLNHSST